MASKSFLGNSALTRGVRNNNPGNIKKSFNSWLGKIKSTDPEFEQFNSIIMGLRACMINLRTYYNKYGLNTIRKIINRWAPGSENNTEKYISSVAGFMSLGSNAQLNLNDKSTLIQLTKAIVKHECSPDHDKITHEDYLEAYNLLGDGSGSVGLSFSSSSPTSVKSGLNISVIIGLLVALVCGFLLFKK